MDIYRRHVFSILVTSILVLAISAGINYIADPAALFKGEQYEAGAAKLLLEGWNVANIGNYDERLLQKNYINNLSRHMDTIVVGSSRSMMINESFFSNRSFFNHSVSGASIEDYIAIFQLYEDRGMKPNTIVMGLDPWILNKASGQTRWRTLEKEFNSSVVGNEKGTKPIELGAAYYQINKYRELISMSYLRASVRKLLLIAQNKQSSTYFPTKEIAGDMDIRLRDGSIQYNASCRNQNVNEVRVAAQNYMIGSVYSLNGFDKLDERDVKLFESFVDYLQGQKVDVIFFLSPYHPVVYDAIKNDSRYRMVLAAQNYFASFAQIRGIRLVGSYNPYDVGGTEDEFLDGMHPKESIARKIMDAGK